MKAYSDGLPIRKAGIQVVEGLDALTQMSRFVERTILFQTPNEAHQRTLDRHPVTVWFRHESRRLRHTFQKRDALNIPLEPTGAQEARFCICEFVSYLPRPLISGIQIQATAQPTEYDVSYDLRC
jgi:hypothetical protein